MGIKSLLSKNLAGSVGEQPESVASSLRQVPVMPQFAANEGSIDPTNPELAILVVHGMGNQQPGHMLQRIGESLVATINGWGVDGETFAARLLPKSQEAFATEKIARFRLSSFRRHDHGDARFEPPHAVIDVQDQRDPDGYEKWLLAEAWWAEDYPVSDFTGLAKWGLGFGPRIIFRNVETSGLNGSMNWRPAQLPIALLLTVLFQAVVVALSTLRPVPKIGGMVNRVILALTTSLGDVNAMVAHDMSRTAMLRTIDRSLDWLKVQSRVPEESRVVVIAHSQGTYLCYEVLQQSRHKPALFVTFGTAMKKIHLANHVQQYPERLSFGVVYAIGSAFAVVIGCTLLWQSRNHLALDRSTLDVVGVLLLALFCMTSLTYLNLLPLAANEQAAFEEKPIMSSWKLPMIASLLPPVLLWLALGAANEWNAPEGFSWSWPPLDHLLTLDNWLTAALFAFGLIVCAGFIIEWRHPDRLQTHLTRLVASGVAVVMVGSILTGLDQGFSAIDYACLLFAASLACGFCAVPLPFGPANFSSPGLHLPWGTPWINFWARADPVPDRDLNDVADPPHANPPTIQDVTVVNQNRISRDHSIYPENIEEFVTPLAERLVNLTGKDMLNDAQARVRNEAQRKRHARVEVLTLSTRTVAVSLLLACLVLQWDGIARFGTPLSKVRGTFETTLENLGIGKELVRVVLDDRVLGLITLAAIAAIVNQFVLFEGWRGWDKSCTRSMFSSLDEESRRNANVAALMMLALTVAVVLLAVFSGYIARCIETGTLHEWRDVFRNWNVATWLSLAAVVFCLGACARIWFRARL